MKGERRAIQTAAVAFVGIIAIAVIGLGYLSFTMNASQTSRSSSISESITMNEGSLSFTSGISPEGLQLKLMLNSSSIQSYGAITAQIEVVNTLSQNVTLTPMPEWDQTIPALNQNLKDLNSYDYICSDNPSYFLANFVLFKGHYSAGNISSAGTPLQLAPPFYHPCNGYSTAQSKVTFPPNGNRAIAQYVGNAPYPITAQVNATTSYCTGSGLSGYGGGTTCGLGNGLVGYWNSNVDPVHDFNFTSPAFVRFPPGEYTIMAFDAWSQFVYATFIVL